MSFSATATASTSGPAGAGAGAGQRVVYSSGSGLGSAFTGGGELAHDDSRKHAASAAVSGSSKSIFQFLGRGGVKLFAAGQRLTHGLAGLSGFFDQPLVRLKQPIELGRVVGFGDALFVAIDVAANAAHEANDRHHQKAEEN